MFLSCRHFIGDTTHAFENEDSEAGHETSENAAEEASKGRR